MNKKNEQPTKVRIIDTHSHIYVDKFNDDIDEVINRAKSSGVEKILLPNIDVESIEQVHQLASSYPNYCIPMMGLHPTSVKEDWEEDLMLIKSQFDTNKYIAVGEIGIDLYWDKTFLAAQQSAFREQLQWSIDYDLPVAIHTREATAEVIECIKQVGVEKLRGVFHSFVGTRDELKEISALKNFYIGINGVVTYKNSDLREVLLDTNLSNIIIETDAPYLTPMPYRGRRNESAYTIYVVEELSRIYNLSPVEVGRITTRNAIDLFRV